MDHAERKVKELKNLYSRTAAGKLLLIGLGIIAVGMLAVLAAYLGAASLGWKRVVSAIGAGLFPGAFSTDKIAYSIIWSVRFPRILAGIIAGAGLAAAGAGMQGITRNPLASPFTIGISAAAGLGATIAIVLGYSLMGGYAGANLIVLNSFGLCLLTTVLILGLSELRGMTQETPILAGIVVTYLLNALASLLKYIALEEQVSAVVNWLFGSLAGVAWKDILPMALITGFGVLLLLKNAWNLNSIGSGDEAAMAMGVNVRRVRKVIMLLVSLVTAGIISFTGVIGFVCVIAPHIGRMMVGSDHRFLLPFSCVIGSLLLLSADTVGRTLLSPIEIPVGIVVSLLGAPFFFYLFLTRRRSFWS
ncbi:iron complex transport system permease protein [Hydrogenispora ethanolica]|jgi:iron complex transport system permease protein|uniref:Iron complex transport system permease protein n=1 Tax=Hydrogenispora ethanolica TaxID=1082276 RepID=A0A4V6NH12_HYDET|nr:iron ABC transporter permease [Hydrogenispora ethanolica]TCL70857.1 iron complex transport system permease protein [Hydrogenispora ethanolica]